MLKGFMPSQRVCVCNKKNKLSQFARKWGGLDFGLVIFPSELQFRIRWVLYTSTNIASTNKTALTNIFPYIIFFILNHKKGKFYLFTQGFWKEQYLVQLFCTYESIIFLIKVVLIDFIDTVFLLIYLYIIKLQNCLYHDFAQQLQFNL